MRSRSRPKTGHTAGFGNSSGVPSCPVEAPTPSFLLHICTTQLFLPNISKYANSAHIIIGAYTSCNLLCCHVCRFLRLDDLWHGEPVWPVQLVLVVPIVEAMSQPNTPDDIEVCSCTCHKMPAKVSSITQCRIKTTYHQPWPSSTNPQGMPISRRHLINFAQCTLSRCQTAKPPKNMLRPAVIIVHIVRRIS